MDLVERIVAGLALALFVAFSFVLFYFVPDIDLAITLAVVSAMAGYDFWLYLWRPAPRSGER